MNKVPWIVGAVLVALIAVRIGIGLTNRGTDQQQIQSALQRSIEASKDGRPGGVLQLLSNQLTFNGQDANGNLGQIAQFIVKQRPDVDVEKPDPVITGDEAQIISPVDIKLDFLGQQRSIHLKDVILVFHREQSMKYLVFPTTDWKLSEVRAEQVDSSDFMQ